MGSHLVRDILARDLESCVVIYDNFSSGKMHHLNEVKDDKRLEIIREDVKDRDILVKAVKGANIVYHFASNPDISKALVQPEIDFWEGTYLTNNVLEAMRTNRVERLIYASGSGVYGDTGSRKVDEDFSPKLPISTYGASKLACESLICAYCHMFDISATCLRFANVVGPNQTHGVGYDFVRKLMNSPDELAVMGDGRQSKSYIYVSDVVNAMRFVERKDQTGFSCYNVATEDYLEVREIADIVVEIMGLKNVKYKYTGGDRGWKGDVPVVRLNSEKLRRLGWMSKYTSREAIYRSVKAIYDDLRFRQ